MASLDFLPFLFGPSNRFLGCDRISFDTTLLFGKEVGVYQVVVMGCEQLLALSLELLKLSALAVASRISRQKTGLPFEVEFLQDNGPVSWVVLGCPGCGSVWVGEAVSE